MTETPRNLARCGLAIAVAAGALAIALVGGPALSANATVVAQQKPPTITTELTRRGPTFRGPAQVETGQRLRIKNNTNPGETGPHTFSLVRKASRPKTRKALGSCYAPGKICRDVGRAHRFSLEGVGRHLVKAGRRGWDRAFTSKRRGDSWYTDLEGQTIAQRVSAPAGTTLYYMCVIHPGMQSHITVVGGS